MMAARSVTVAMLLVIVSSQTVSSQPCRRLLMQGLDNTNITGYASFSGLYRLTDDQHDGRPVYENPQLTDHQYFYYNRSLGMYVLGGGYILGQVKVHRLPQSNVTYPYSDVITQWHVYRPSTESFQTFNRRTILPRCVDDFIHRCDSDQVEFNEALTLNVDNSGTVVNITKYQRLSHTYSEYRPVYSALTQHPSVRVYLYHVGGSWHLGEDYRRPSVYARVEDSALVPEYISNVWQLHYNNQWNSNRELRLQCTGIQEEAGPCTISMCENGGKCFVHDSSTFTCECPPGYHGLRCDKQTPKCPDFRSWSNRRDVSYISLDSYEGSLASWFCLRGSYPEFGYSQCVRDTRGRLMWSRRPYCTPLYTPSTTTRSWYGRTTDRQKKTDLFKTHNAWLIPVVSTLVVLLQLCAPFIIYCILVGCCGYTKNKKSQHAKADEKEDSALAGKYRQQLEELGKQDTTLDAKDMLLKLNQLEQELQGEVDDLRARRRQRDRESRKNVKIFRIISCYCYVSFWLWVIYLAIGIAAKLGLYASVFGTLAIIAIVFIIILPFVFYIETCCSSERQYIKNLSSLTSATDRIESIRESQPMVTMNAECYHYELRTRTVYYTDANGNSQTRIETYQEKVVTAFIKEPYFYRYWYDSSQNTLTDIRKVGITKIKMELAVQFGDEATARDFTSKYDKFQKENRYRDVYVNFFTLSTVPGFEKRLAAYTNASSKPCWIGSVWFWISAVFCLGWPYRILFNRATGKTDYNIVKVIYVDSCNNPSVANTDDNTSVDQEPISIEDETSGTKTRIHAMIDRLTIGLDASTQSNEETTLTRAATDEHMNVTLREARHVPTN